MRTQAGCLVAVEGLECLIDVVTDREGDLGRGRDHPRQPTDGRHRDQAADNLLGLGVRQASIAGSLQGVAAGVTRKLHSTLGGAELLVDDLQGSLHRVGTEATDTLVERMVEELQEEQHRHDHRDHGPHE